MAEAASEEPAGLPPPPGSRSGATGDVGTTTGESLEMSRSKKARHRLLRGMQRISSSPSLTRISRARSMGNYSTRASLSCVSLALATGLPPGSQASPSLVSSLAPTPSPFSPCGTPSAQVATTETSPHDDAEARLGTRKVKKAGAEAGAGLVPVRQSILWPRTTVPLPTDIRLMAKMTAKARDGDRTKMGSPARTAGSWAALPHELQIHILSFLGPQELVRVSRVSRSFYAACFDGQVWKSLDMSGFYRTVPAKAMASMATVAGPFARNLNLRGCVQVEQDRCADVLFKTCKNLQTVTLEGCRGLRASSLNDLVRGNEGLVRLNLTGLSCVTNTTCALIADSCSRLEMLNVSWCSHIMASGLGVVIRGCTRLRDLRAAEVRGFNDLETAEAIFVTNRLERLVLAGCANLTDDALKMMMHGADPEMDILGDVPVVPTRRLRHLDLSRCSLLTSNGVRSLAHLVPDLEGLILSGCNRVQDVALRAVFASTPNLTHLELANMGILTNSLFASGLALSPCAPRLRHLSVSVCEGLGDSGLLPVVKECIQLESLRLDNTRVSNFVLAEAVDMVQKRSGRSGNDRAGLPRVGLHLVVYDCIGVTMSGIRDVLYRNARATRGGAGVPELSGPGLTYPSEIISLECSHEYQQIVDEHTKRVLRGDHDAAHRLEKCWGDWMQAVTEAAAGLSARQGRRRHLDPANMWRPNGGGDTADGRPRATSAGSCVVM